jgi:hypothetical protein
LLDDGPLKLVKLEFLHGLPSRFFCVEVELSSGQTDERGGVSGDLPLSQGFDIGSNTSISKDNKISQGNGSVNIGLKSEKSSCSCKNNLANSLSLDLLDDGPLKLVKLEFLHGLQGEESVEIFHYRKDLISVAILAFLKIIKFHKAMVVKMKFRQRLAVCRVQKLCSQSKKLKNTILVRIFAWPSESFLLC